MADSGLLAQQLAAAEAKIQAEVGEFLGLKAKLLPFTRSPNPAVQAEAQRLMNKQQLLEVDLKTSLETIEDIKEGGLVALFVRGGDVYKVAQFAKTLKTHKDRVNKFIKSGGQPGAAGMPGIDGNALLWIGIAAGVGGFFYYMKGRK